MTMQILTPSKMMVEHNTYLVKMKRKKEKSMADNMQVLVWNGPIPSK